MANMSFLKEFDKELSKIDGVGTSSLPPRYWYSTGNYVLNRIISGSFNKGIPQGRITNLAGSSGAGKAQPLTAKILTPTGWKYMGDLLVGDVVLTPTGEQSNIIAVHPQGEKDIYTITFSDGSTTRCCKEHLWSCSIPKYDSMTNTTEQIIDTESIMKFLTKKRNKKSVGNISIKLIEPLEYPTIEYDIPPYLLGCLLGDGNITVSTPTITTEDYSIITNIRKILEDDEDYIINHKANTITYSVRQRNIINQGGKLGCAENKYTTHLKTLNLWGCRSHEKFIPTIYKNGSIEQRLELIRGLMDTDGTVGKNREISYSTSSYIMAKDVQGIMWSLGAKCSIKTRYPFYRDKNGKKITGKDSYDVRISYKFPKQLFTLQRKIDKCSEQFQEKQLRRRVKSVEYTSTEEAQCITIDHPDSLYITDDYIVTHNSFLAANLVKAAQQAGAYCLVVDTENALDDEFMNKIGVDTDRSGYRYADVTTIPQVINVVSTFLKGYKKEYGEAEDAPQILILIDSLDMLMTETEEDNYGKGVAKGDQGQRNKQLKAMLRSFVQDIKKLNVAMVVTSQVYKNQDVTNGEGNWIVSDAVKYAASQIILLSKLKLKDDSGKIQSYAGIRMKCEGYKTRFTKPFQTITIEVPYETGMDPYSGLIDVSTELGVLTRGGSWYTLAGTDQKFQAKELDQYASVLLDACESKSEQFIAVRTDDYVIDTDDDQSAKSRRQAKALAETQE